MLLFNDISQYQTLFMINNAKNKEKKTY